MRNNSLLGFQSVTENIQSDINTIETVNDAEVELDELQDQQETMDAYVEDKLEPLVTAHDIAADTHEVQINNLKILNGDEDAEYKKGGFIVAPNEEDGPKVIREQMLKETAVLENISGIILGSFNISTEGRNASQTLYSILGIKKTPFTAKEIYMESLNGSSLQSSKVIYQSHVEGFGDTVKGLASQAWEGIKSLIKMIMDFIKNLIANKESIKKSLDQAEKRVNDITSNVSNFDLSDDFKKGITEISPSSVVLACENPETYIHEIVDTFSSLEALYGNDTETKKVNQTIFDFEERYIKARKFTGVEFKSIEKRNEAALGMRSKIDEGVSSMKLQLGSVNDVCSRIGKIIGSLKEEFDQVFNAISKYPKMLEKRNKAVEKMFPVKSQLDREIAKMQKDELKDAKRLISIPKAFIGACKLGFSGIIEKKN